VGTRAHPGSWRWLAWLSLGAVLNVLPAAGAPAATPVEGQSWTNTLGMKFVPAGSPGILFCIWDTRVEDFRAFVKETNYDATQNMRSMNRDGWSGGTTTWMNPGFIQTEDCPVVGVAVIDGNAFCAWLTQKEQSLGKLGPNQIYRLPRDDEWSRAVGKSFYPWGNDWPPPPGSCNMAGREADADGWQHKEHVFVNYEDNFPRTSPVGSFKPNAFGIYDMAGNVIQPAQASDSHWLRRGSAWDSTQSSQMLSDATGSVGRVSGRTSDHGFRVVLVVNPNLVPPLGATPMTAAPESSAPAASPGPPPPPAQLPADLERAVVLIRGDRSTGTGFLVKTPDGPTVVTNLHVLFDNPNLQILPNFGPAIPMLSLKGAVDRDLAMISVKDDNFTCFDLAKDVGHSAKIGDAVITPGNSEGGGVMLNTAGRLLGIGPERIEFDNPVFHGNSGGPVFDVGSSQVLGVVTEAEKVDVSNEVDGASFKNPGSAIRSTMRYFGLRLDTVPGWETYDWNRYLEETAFIEKFHLLNRCLDSYLNTTNSSSAEGGDDEGPLDPRLYLKDDKIKRANDNYFSLARGADSSQSNAARQELLSDLSDLANTEVEQMQNMANFYSFEQQLAKDELAYRKALRDELDTIGASTDRLFHLPRASN
jgi:S1-C subfamily serine protease